MLRLLLVFLLPEPWKHEHGRRFDAGKHVRVILTSAATDCVHAVFGVHTKYIKKGVSPFCVKMNPHPSLLLWTNTRAQKLLVWPPVSALCCCEHHRSNPQLFGQSLVVSWDMAAFYCIYSHKWFIQKLKNPKASQFTQYTYLFPCLLFL